MDSECEEEPTCFSVSFEAKQESKRSFVHYNMVVVEHQQGRKRSPLEQQCRRSAGGVPNHDPPASQATAYVLFRCSRASQPSGTSIKLAS